MNLDMKDLDEILIKKTGMNLQQNLNNRIENTPKNKYRIYLTKIQFEYLKLITNVTKLSFIKESEFKNVILDLLDKKQISEVMVDKYKIHVMNLLKTNPRELYPYLDNLVKKTYFDKIRNLKNLIMPTQNLKCLYCNQISYRFNSCLKHFNNIVKKKVSNILLHIFDHHNYKFNSLYLSILERDLVDKIKIIDKSDENIFDLDIKISRINNIIDYAKDYNDIALRQLIFDFITYNSKELRQYFKFLFKPNNKKHQGKVSYNINNYINKHNIDNINKKIKNKIIELNTLDNYHFIIGKNVNIDYTKKQLNFVTRLLYQLKKNYKASLKKNDVIMLLNSIDIKNFINKELNEEYNVTTKYNILIKIYGSGFQVRNLSLNKYFEDHYYNGTKSLTYDIYGEIYNIFHKRYIPFVINIKNIIVTDDTIKNFYCFISNIPFLIYNNDDKFATIEVFLKYVSCRENFFVYGRLE